MSFNLWFVNSDLLRPALLFITMMILNWPLVKMTIEILCGPYYGCVYILELTSN